METEEKSEGLIKDSYELIIKEIQSILTVLYLLMIGIGMIFNYQKYDEFGINIFQYSNLFDYLIAPFADFKIVIFSTLTLIFTLLFVRMDSWLNKKFPVWYSKMNFGWDKKPWFNTYRTVLFVVLFIMYLFVTASAYGEISKKEIEQKEKTILRYVDGKQIEGIMIGKTNEVIFLKQENKVIAIPYASIVKEIEIGEIETEK